jgi:hypothetical protein
MRLSSKWVRWGGAFTVRRLAQYYFGGGRLNRGFKFKDAAPIVARSLQVDGHTVDMDYGSLIVEARAG